MDIMDDAKEINLEEVEYLEFRVYAGAVKRDTRYFMQRR